MLRSEGHDRTFRQNVELAVLLAWVAGAVNAAGFFVLGMHTSHMTGTAAAVGEALANVDPSVAWQAVTLLASFVTGAASAAALLDLNAKRVRGRYSPALLLEASVLAGAAWWAASHPAHGSLGLARALCFAMGLQNALVTRISAAVIRTTHLTGVLTDIGIELVRVVEKSWAVLREQGPRGVGGAIRGLLDFERLWLHVSLLFSFLVGATMGPYLVLRWQALALAVPCLVLLGLIALDWRAPKAVSVPDTRRVSE